MKTKEILYNINVIKTEIDLLKTQRHICQDTYDCILSHLQNFERQVKKIDYEKQMYTLNNGN